jgi:hypothetical protein
MPKKINRSLSKIVVTVFGTIFLPQKIISISNLLPNLANRQKCDLKNVKNFYEGKYSFFNLRSSWRKFMSQFFSRAAKKVFLVPVSYETIGKRSTMRVNSDV